MSKLYFFRHAQASFLADDYDKLSPLGEKQSAELGKYLVEKNLHFDKIFIGPLHRQKRTFEIVADIFTENKKSIPKPIFIEELKEHSGTEAMKTIYPELAKTVPKVHAWLEEIKTNPRLRKRNSLLVFQYFMDEWAEGNIEIPGIESWKHFRKNAKKGLDTVLTQTGRGEIIGVFTSGGTISSITADSLHIQNEKRVAAMNFSIRNTSFGTFLYSKDQFNLLSFNELPHLEEEMVTFV